MGILTFSDALDSKSPPAVIRQIYTVLRNRPVRLTISGTHRLSAN